jgi:NTP pyrophosphatase (non-canonical NTP hydrolase)
MQPTTTHTPSQTADLADLADLGDLGDLGLREAQAQVDEWIRTVGLRYFDPLTNGMILAEEVGEVARILAREYGQQSWKVGRKPQNPQAALADELADVLFVTLCLANQTGVDMSQALRTGLAKRTQRDAQRHADNPKLAEQPILDDARGT